MSNARIIQARPALHLRGKPPGALMLLLTTAAIGAAFFLTEHDHSLSMKDLVDPDASSMELSTQEGNLQRQIGFGLLFATGLACIFAARQKPTGTRGFLAYGLLFCLAWCAVSVAWSADVPLTVRRVGVLVCFSIGALGVGRSFTLRQLCIMSVAISGTYLAIGLADEILQGVFQPLAPAYRFTGHVHPNLQASFCAAICLGSLCLMDRRDSLRYALAVCAAVGLIFLILTKSRTASIAFVAACAVIAAYRVSRRQALVIGISAGFLLGVVVLAASVAGIDLERTVVHTVLIGRTDDAMSLTGRVPLWHQLLATVNERILTGFGVGAYWTPQHIHLASAVVGSGVTHAHCAYIEAVLNVGIVGLIAYLLTAGAAVREIFRRCNVHAEGGILFLAALMAFAFVHACAEALFVSTSILPFFAAAGLVHLAFHPEELPSRRHGPAVSDRASPADADVALSGSPRT